LLKNKLTLATQTVNTFARPDKRFRSRGMIMPGPKKLDNDALENVKICIDTSGSISPRDLGVALTQIDQLFKKFHADAEVLYWDTRIRAIYPFEDPKELVNKKPMGGGGTDANCIFEYFEENKDYRIGKKKKPSIIIVFTDGCFGDVHKRYSKYKDTIWVINGNYDFTAPFGSKAMFKRDE
jgi:predicted metal-dependent peptidase